MNLTHGQSNTPTYTVWCSMRQRCDDPNHKNYARWGGRGISVCDRWRSFENFYVDMGEKPKGMTIDRINNDGNYEPSNCRWATRKEQRHNRGDELHMITWNGKTQCIADWEAELGMSYNMLRRRILRDKMSLEEAMQPVSKLNVKHTANGISLTIKEWAAKTGIKEVTIKMRMHRGETIEQAISDRSRPTGGVGKVKFNNKAGEFGIGWLKDRQRWTVRIKDRKYGQFESIEEAIARRDQLLNTPS